MTTALTAGQRAEAAAELLRTAPQLVDGFRAALPRAASTVTRRLLGALYREDIADSRDRYGPAATARHAFDRAEFDSIPFDDEIGVDDPAALLPPGLPAEGRRALAAELGDAVVNLAVAYARIRATGPVAGAPGMDAGAADPDQVALDSERRATDGHNLHPCGRTRLGWSVADLLRHDIEAGGTTVRFVAVRRDLHVGDDVGDLLAAVYPQTPSAPAGYLVQPVHAWQRGLLWRRYADLVRGGALRDLPGALPVQQTAALRTVLLPAGVDGRRRYLKLSLDIQVTSTRRTISVASTRNGPVVSGLLHRLLAGDPAGARVLLLPELAGAALVAGTGRDAGVIVRDGLAGRLEPGEAVVSGAGLSVGSVLSGLVTRFAASRGLPDRAAAALAFVDEYAHLLLPAVLRLCTRFGIGLEAHLQNCLPTFVAGVPHRLVLRDFAGLRLHRPRMAAAGVTVPLWPRSVVATDDVDVLRAKVCYTALQAHLGELVVRLVGSHGLDEAVAWRRVRAVVDAVYDELRTDPSCAVAAAADHAALTTRYVPHKALVRMRLAGGGDLYVPVRNPLHHG